MLLRQAETWASGKGRPLDQDLLEPALEVWARHTEHDVRRWPTGSAGRFVESTDEPHVRLLVESLESFWRFLRSTGRMRSGSAEPAALTKEAWRAVRKVESPPPSPASSQTIEQLLQEWPGDLWDDEFEDEELDDEDLFDEDYQDYLRDLAREDLSDPLSDDWDEWDIGVDGRGA